MAYVPLVFLLASVIMHLWCHNLLVYGSIVPERPEFRAIPWLEAGDAGMAVWSPATGAMLAAGGLPSARSMRRRAETSQGRFLVLEIGCYRVSAIGEAR